MHDTRVPVGWLSEAVELLQKYGYGDMEVVGDYGEIETLFSSQKLRSMLSWQHRYDWREIVGK